MGCTRPLRGSQEAVPGLSIARDDRKAQPHIPTVSASSCRHSGNGDTMALSAGPPPPGQDPPAQPGSIPASRGAGDGARGQPGSATAQKGSLFPPAFPGGAGAAQPGPGRRLLGGGDGRPPPAFTPLRHPVLQQRGRKLLAATAKPAHTTAASCWLSPRAAREDSHHP